MTSHQYSIDKVMSSLLRMVCNIKLDLTTGFLYSGTSLLQSPMGQENLIDGHIKGVSLLLGVGSNLMTSLN